MKNKFIFKRIGDGVIYTFNPESNENPTLTWKREGKDLWCKNIGELGWAIVDSNNHVLGLPSATPKSHESPFPPEGEWVSNKDGKSYIYSLIYIN